MATNVSPLSEYITRPELARQLGRSTRTLDRWHVQRRGPRRTKIGRTKLILYNRRHVQEWLEAHAEEQPA